MLKPRLNDGMKTKLRPTGNGVEGRGVLPEGASSYVPALGFHSLTPCYDTVVGLTTRERTFKKKLIRQAGIEPRQRVLDLACGTGTLAIWIKQSQPLADVIGVDGDATVLSLATSKALRTGVSVLFDRAMSCDLPYPDGHFDRVLSSLFFHHLSWEDKERTAREIHRVLRPGGELHVADWGKATNIVMRGLFVSIQLLDGFSNTRDNVSGKLVELFDNVGFHGVSPTTNLATMFGTMALYRAVKAD